MAYGTRGFGFSYTVTPVVKKLLIANFVVFLATFALGSNFVFDWFAFQPQKVLTRPWGVFTYMFVHGGFGHIFMNMLVLFFFGPPLEARWGSREFFKFYVICGLGGVVLSPIFVPTSSIVGASAAVYGLMLAFAMNWPNAPIYIYAIFPVKAKWLVAFLFTMTLLSAFGQQGGPIAHFAHLGGLLAAFLYLKSDWRGAGRLERIKRSATRVRRLAIVPREEAESSAQAQEGWEPEDERRMLDQVDQVLDKISAQGMASLTSAERQLLDEVSRRHRMN